MKLLFSQNRSSALAQIYVHMNIDRGVNIGCERRFCIAFNNKFALLLISNFINANQPKVREMCKTTHPPRALLLYFVLKLFSKSCKVHEIWWLILKFIWDWYSELFFQLQTGFWGVSTFSRPVLFLTMLVVF